MKTSSEGYQQCYNAWRWTRSTSSGATDLTANASDLPLDAVKETSTAGRRCSDAGYCNERDLNGPGKVAGVDGYVAPGREGSSGVIWRSIRRRVLMEKLATPAGREAYAERKSPAG